MQIVVGADGCSVVDCANLKALSALVLQGVDVAGSLGAAGTLDADGAHLWLSIDWLQEAAAVTVSVEERSAWREGFAGMIAYAAKSGWVSADGASVRAHLAV